MSSDITNPTNSNASNPIWTSEFTAGAQAARTNVGIILDSLNVPFTQLQSYHSTGSMFNNDSYKASSENPMLDHNLSTVYGQISDVTAKAVDEAWKDVLIALKAALPDDIREAYEKDQENPESDRSLVYTSLDNALLLGAPVLRFLDTSANVTDVSSVVAARTELNTVLPYIAQAGALSVNAEITSNVHRALDDLGGPNYPHFDHFNGILNDMKSPLALLEGVKDSIDQAIDGVLPASARADAALAADGFARIRSHMDAVQGDGSFRIIHYSLGNLETTSRALSTEAPSTYLALDITTQGLRSNDASAGFVGGTLSAATGDVPQFLSGLAMPNAPDGVHTMVGNLGILGNTLLIGLASQGVTSTGVNATNLSLAPLMTLAALFNGGADPLMSFAYAAAALTAACALGSFGKFPTKNPEDVPAAHFLAFETLLNGIVGADMIGAFYRSFLESIGGDTQGAERLAPVLTMISLILIILSAVSYGKQAPESVLAQFGPSLRQGLNALKGLLEKSNAEGPAIDAANVAVDEALHAIDNSDYERFMSALSNLLDLSGSSLETLNKDIQTVRGAAAVLAQHLGENNSDPVAGVITVA